ncbi:hypothetical protein [Clostridium baratii]|uniref:hypothetical protein n=1 Tax=Clostridium baratii TaxID=1561 RepID=UPI0030CD2AB6
MGKINIGKILKKANENMPEFIKKMLSSSIRNRVIKNKTFLEQVSEIDKFYKLNSEQKEEYHLSKLKEILIYSYENTIFYRKRFDEAGFNPYKFNNVEELNKIPTINKQIVLDNFDELISNEKIDHYVAYTGGSTGRPLTILLDTASIYKEKAFVYKYWSKFGYDYKKSKIATFRGLEFKKKLYKYNPIDTQIILNPFKLNENNIEEYVKIIDKFNPEFFHGYISAIYNFCRLINKKGLKLKSNIKCVFFVSENTSEKEVDYIRETLNCETNIFYGHSERAVFAEYIEGGYEFNNLYTHVDLLNTTETNIYEIACTGLINKKMPLIRYVPDDSIQITDKGIQVHGHWDKELLIGENDEKISIASINFHNDIFSKIKYYQFEQFERGKVTLNIVEDTKINDKDKELIINTINSKLKNVINTEIKLVDKIELTNRGKYKKIIKHI